jgi:hypothetical protein
MGVPEEPVCIGLFRQNPVFISLHLKSPVHVVPPLTSDYKSNKTYAAYMYTEGGGGRGLRGGVENRTYSGSEQN